MTSDFNKVKQSTKNVFFFFNRMTETLEINEQTLTATDFNLSTFPFYLLFGFEMLFFNQGYHEEILLSLALTSIPLS